MKDKTRISLSQWNQLSHAGKEKLKMWSLNQGYELDLIPGISGSFDPSCDYAALLTDKQLIAYIHHNSNKIYKTDVKTLEALWSKILELVESS